MCQDARVRMLISDTTSKLLGDSPKNHFIDFSSAQCPGCENTGLKRCFGSKRHINASSAKQSSILYSPKHAQCPAQEKSQISALTPTGWVDSFP